MYWMDGRLNANQRAVACEICSHFPKSNRNLCAFTFLRGFFLHKKDNTSIDWDTNATFVWFSSQITSSLVEKYIRNLNSLKPLKKSPWKENNASIINKGAKISQFWKWEIWEWEISNLNGLGFKYFKSLTSEDELVNKIINMWNVIHHLLWKFVNSNK